MDKDTFIRRINEKGPPISSAGKAEPKPPEPDDRDRTFAEGSPIIPPLFLELTHRIKNTLSSIKNVAQLSRGKFRDMQFEEYFHRSIREDIERIESVINGLLNYVKVSTPMIKTNTVHALLEDSCEKLKDQIEEKKIRLFKKFEKGLPETVVHDEQLRYVLHSVLQYAIASSPANGSIGILTKLFDRSKTAGDKRGFPQKDGRYVEVLMGFTGFRKPVVGLESGFRNSGLQRDEAMDLVLRLAKEIVHKNRGIVQIDVDEKRSKTFISLVFPAERRKVIYYPKAGA